MWFYEQVGDEPTKAIERADKLFALSDRIGDPDLRLEAHHSRWAVRLFLGDLDGARADAPEGLLADVEARTGDAPAALARLRGNLVKDGQTRYFDAEVSRRIGELTLLTLPGEREKAAQDFRRAVDIARRQGARTLELRAALALARLLVAQGQNEDARDTLGPIAAAMTTDAVLPELSEAHALLADIS